MGPTGTPQNPIGVRRDQRSRHRCKIRIIGTLIREAIRFRQLHVDATGPQQRLDHVEARLPDIGDPAEIVECDGHRRGHEFSLHGCHDVRHGGKVEVPSVRGRQFQSLYQKRPGACRVECVSRIQNQAEADDSACLQRRELLLIGVLGDRSDSARTLRAELTDRIEGRGVVCGINVGIDDDHALEAKSIQHLTQIWRRRRERRVVAVGRHRESIDIGNDMDMRVTRMGRWGHRGGARRRILAPERAP